MAFPASAVAAALWLFTSGAMREAAVAREMEQLRGTWVLVEMHQNGCKLPPEWFRRVGLKSTFTKAGHYHTERTDHNNVDGVIAAIDPTRIPKTIDLLAESGSFRGQTSFCIYELKGDSLRLYYVTEATDATDRPTEFPKEYVRSRFTYAIYCREKPE